MTSGLGEVTYLWTFNNTDISQLDQFTNRTNILSFGSQLVITNLRLEDSGLIGCEATNQISVSRHQANLTVTRARDQRKVSLGEKAVLACPLGGGSDVLISWVRDSHLVTTHPVLEDGSLLIKAVAPSDLGEYLCQAEHLRERESLADCGFQPGPLSLVEECRALALIGRELYSIATPALLCHKEPARASIDPMQEMSSS